ncbi:MAG: tRNA (adenosine(37)-N6)-threonylcarbamoyltransferase complex dimerization subunit type 1 TsaB [Clostridiales bacterium]|nr:tRNA (adenosine(37)-N6)-threonylcarbamoyltransferase complex dimerization subunit type 1 TsaB [Candidatus Cacconaster stercorequi]
MKILALETSAKSVSAAVVENGVPLAYTYQNTGLTHSRTLMPLVDAMLSSAELKLEDMDLLAVSAGPGSFTGLRIGVSALKGLAWAQDLPCCGVSTLEAMAQNMRHLDTDIICAMDARRNQVYNAVFHACGGQLTRLTPDRAISLAELAEKIKDSKNTKIIVGDGAQLCYTYLLEQGIPCHIAPPHLVMQNAVGVALAAQEMADAGQTTTARDLVPVYLRLSQAERERLARGLKITVD